MKTEADTPQTFRPMFGPVEMVARNIITRLQKGLTISPAVQACIESTLGELRAEVLSRHLQDEADSHSDPLQELLFFPDDAFQEDLEPCLQMAGLLPVHQEELIRTLSEHTLTVPFFSIESSATRRTDRPCFHLAMPAALWPDFVRRLKVWKRLPAVIETVWHEKPPPAPEGFIRVSLRNAALEWNDSLVEFFVMYFNRAVTGEAEFRREFALLLKIIAEHPDTHDVKALLIRKRQHLLRQLHQYESFEHHRTRFSMDIMMLQRASAPALDAPAVRMAIADIDSIRAQIWSE